MAHASVIIVYNNGFRLNWPDTRPQMLFFVVAVVFFFVSIQRVYCCCWFLLVTFDIGYAVCQLATPTNNDDNWLAAGWLANHNGKDLHTQPHPHAHITTHTHTNSDSYAGVFKSQWLLRLSPACNAIYLCAYLCLSFGVCVCGRVQIFCCNKLQRWLTVATVN